MERRVLIVESQNDFALTMASVLKNAGYQTTLAASAADAQRELEKRRPDLVVLRAELPDQSGFVLCGTIRKGKFGQNLPVILLSSDVGAEALQQHAQSANAANGYLAIPFEMGELTTLTQTFVQPGAAPSQDDLDADLDNALTGGGPTEGGGPQAPPPLRVSAGGPPRLPRRERRSALTDDDRSFLDRAFSSIADRKAELLAESREVRRSTPRREQMGTPEAKIQILRDELKSREAQIARISEIWSVRERELLSVEDRLSEKDVEIQGHKMQIDDLSRRLNESQNTLVEKEREHGRQVEDLLLQKFIGEKEVIEVVSAKEKEVNVLRKEKAGLEEELSRRGAELDGARKDFEQLEKDYQLATLEFEVKEKELQDAVAQRGEQIAGLQANVEELTGQLEQTVSERDTRYADYEGQLKALTETLEKNQAERDGTVADLESKLRLSEEHAQASDREGERLQGELADAKARAAEKIGDLEGEIATLHTQLEALNTQKAESEQTLAETIEQRDGRITQLEAELADTIERKDREEAELQSQIQARMEQIGELEGEVEAAKAALADREAELEAELGELGAAKDQLEQTLNAQLTETRADRDAKQQSLEQRAKEIQTLQGMVAERDENIQRLSVTLTETQNALLATQQALNETQAALEAKTGEQAQTASALAQTQAELAQVRGERDERQGEVTAARNEIQRVTGLWRQTEQAKAQLEENLSSELGQVRSALAEAQGNYEAEAQAHARLQQESHATITALTGERNELAQRLEATGVDLAATSANLDDALKSLDIEKRAHADTNQHYEAKVQGLEDDLAKVRVHAQDLAENLTATKQELGARVSELTQMNARLAHAEDTRQHLEERITTLSEESQRREELLQNDLATKSKELADTLRKLTTQQQEKVRQVDALNREVHAKTEAARTLEQKLKSLFDESKKKTEDLGGRLATVTAELDAAKKEIAEKNDGLTKASQAQAQAVHERDQVRGQMQTAIQQANARIQEANNAITQEKAAGKKHADELGAKLQRAEARIAQIQQEAATKTQEMETRLKDAQSQLAQRQRRVAELEQAVETSSAARTRSEKELQAKIAAAEHKAQEAMSRLQAAMGERKSVEAKHLKDLEDANTKHKAEMDRREQVKAQEVKRLQEAVQEKSKQLKVVELELARYKNKPGATARPATGTMAARPAPPTPGPAQSQLGDDDEMATKVNAIPVEIAKTAAPPRPAAAPPANKQTGTRPAVSITAAAPQKRPQPGEDRTVVVATSNSLPKSDDDVDFTSIIDNLGE